MVLGTTGTEDFKFFMLKVLTSALKAWFRKAFKGVVRDFNASGMISVGALGQYTFCKQLHGMAQLYSGYIRLAYLITIFAAG